MPLHQKIIVSNRLTELQLYSRNCYNKSVILCFFDFFDEYRFRVIFLVTH